MKSATDPISAKIKALHTEAADLLRQKATDEQIIEALKQHGIDFAYAQTILENAREDVDDKKEFYKLVFGGAFVTFGGVALTVMSYRSAVSWGVFFVFTGLIVAGIASVVRGFIIYKK